MTKGARSGTGTGSGFRLVRHEVVDSTNERALASLADGSGRHRDAHVARAQTAGRGRRGARWESAAGEGLFLSAIWSPGVPLAPPGLTMAGGLAVRDAARSLAGGELAGLALDWPNDVVVRAAKLAGVLVESRGLDPARPSYVVGVGLNVRQRAFGAELVAERAVTSLALEGVDATVDDACAKVLAALGERLEQLGRDSASLARDFAAATGLVGTSVRVAAGGRTLAGRLAALDLERGLSLETASGVVPLALAHVTALERA